METELDAMQQKIGELEARTRAYDAVLKIKNEAIADFMLQIHGQEQAFLDQAAIAAMQSLNTSDYKNYNFLAEDAYNMAKALLAEKKRLQGVNNG